MMRIHGNSGQLNQVPQIGDKPDATRSTPNQHSPSNPLDQLPQEERDLLIAYRAVKAAKSSEHQDTPTEKPNPLDSQTINAARLKVLTDISDHPANQAEFEPDDRQQSQLQYGVVAFMAVEEMYQGDQELLPRHRVDIVA